MVNILGKTNLKSFVCSQLLFRSGFSPNFRHDISFEHRPSTNFVTRVDALVSCHRKAGRQVFLQLQDDGKCHLLVNVGIGIPNNQTGSTDIIKV
jgi:hypothetical protein